MGRAGRCDPVFGWSEDVSSGKPDKVGGHRGGLAVRRCDENSPCQMVRISEYPSGALMDGGNGCVVRRSCVSGPIGG